MTRDVVRLTEVRDTQGKLTHQMCCVCFSYTLLADLWRDAEGEPWDLCSEECARAAGMVAPVPGPGPEDL